MTRTNTISPSSNRRKQAQEEFEKLLAAACVAGFHGSASVTITVQDGHIQYARVMVERLVK